MTIQEQITELRLELLKCAFEIVPDPTKIKNLHKRIEKLEKIEV